MQRYSDQASRPSLGSQSRSTVEDERPATTTNTSVARRAHSSSKEKKPSKKVWLAGVTLLLVGLLGWWLLGRTTGLPSFIDTSKYQSVLLSNNNAFYGKVSEMTVDHIVLKDVFYIQQPTASEGEDAANKFELIKRGDELHGPYDSMLINRSQLVYIENLKDDGKVAQTIKSYQSSKR